MISGPQLKLMVRQTALVVNNAAKIYGVVFGAYEATVGMSRGIKRINKEFGARKAHGQTVPNNRQGSGTHKPHTNESGHDGVRNIEVKKTGTDN